MQAAVLADDGARRHRHDGAAGKAVAEAGEGGRVVGVPVGRHQHGAVHDQEIGVIGRQAATVGAVQRRRHRQRHQLIRAAVGPAQGRELLFQAVQSGVLRAVGHIGAGIGQCVRIAKSRHGVDVAVGVVAQHVAAVHPQQARDAQQRRQRRQQGLRGGRVVARLAQQAGAGGQQGALAVDFDVAAFEHPGQGFDRDLAQRALLSQHGGHGIIELGAVLAAPAVEAEIERHPPAVAQHGQRAVIAHPDVVGGRDRQRQACRRHTRTGQAFCHVAAVILVVAGDDQRLAGRDGGREADEFGFGFAQRVGPVAVRVRPGQQHRCLWRPFGRQITRRNCRHGFGPGCAAPDFFSAAATSGGM